METRLSWQSVARPTASGESRADVKAAVCGYVDACRARCWAPAVVLRAVKQIATDALSYDDWGSNRTRAEAYHLEQERVNAIGDRWN